MVSPRYGNSSDTGVPLTIAEHAADCCALMDHLGIERAHVAALSRGGVLIYDFDPWQAEGVVTFTWVLRPMPARAGFGLGPARTGAARHLTAGRLQQSSAVSPRGEFPLTNVCS